MINSSDPNMNNIIMARRRGDHGGYHPHFKIISFGFELEFPFFRLLAGAILFFILGFLVGRFPW